MTNKIILALDVDNIKIVDKLVCELSDVIKIFKVGLQLYTKYGNKIVEKIINKNVKVFLDLKFHDIPNTVTKGVKNITSLGISYFTVHSLGGSEMLKCAKDVSYNTAIDLGIPPPKVLGVTLLTSLDDKNLKGDFGIDCTSKKMILKLAKLSKKCGLDGVISSPLEVKKIKKICGDSFLVITPGVRQTQDKVDDQKRTQTIKYALSQGADFVVIGRQIINSFTPRKEVEKILKEINLCQK